MRQARKTRRLRISCAKSCIDVLDMLPEGDRQLIDALYFHGESEHDYAKKAGLSQKGVNKRSHATLAKLKIFMKD